MAESRLSCLGLDEFVDSWAALRLGELWRVGVNTRSDRGLHRALFAPVSRVSRGTGQLSHLLNLLSEAGNNNLPPESRESMTAKRNPGSLAILSAVATIGRPE